MRNLIRRTLARLWAGFWHPLDNTVECSECGHVYNTLAHITLLDIADELGEMSRSFKDARCPRCGAPA